MDGTRGRPDIDRRQRRSSSRRDRQKGRSALASPCRDCAEGYGRALRLARIDRLDPERFEQTFTARIGSGPLWPGGRLHTLNRVGALEVIDGVAINPKFAPLRALMARRQAPGDLTLAGEAAPSL